MTVSHILGYPRIGAQRELKKVTEAYWKGECPRSALESLGRELRLRHWQGQQEAGWISLAWAISPFMTRC